MINKISKFLYGAARLLRWLQAISKSIKTGSPKPLLKRGVNVMIGRKIVSKIFVKK